MGLFDRLGKGKKSAEDSAASTFGAYSGMRVEVLEEDGSLLFAGKLSVASGGLCRLQQLSETALPPDPEADPLSVLVRGYDEDQKMAVHISGLLSWESENLWRLNEPRIESKSNDRAFFRQGVDIAGDVRTVGRNGVKAPCHVVNISAGGACIQTAIEMEVEDMCVLSFRLTSDTSLPPLPSEVRRKGKCRAGFEYGCQFLDLNATTEDQIARAIMQIQMAQRKRF